MRRDLIPLWLFPDMKNAWHITDLYSYKGTFLLNFFPIWYVVWNVKKNLYDFNKFYITII